MSRNIDGHLAMNALDKAIENRWSESTHELVHHSDQGVQYASHDDDVDTFRFPSASCEPCPEAHGRFSPVQMSDKTVVATMG